MPQRLTPEEIQNRLNADGRGIVLDASTYVNTRTKARFIDPEYGEWWASPENVLRGSSHPKRSRHYTLTAQEVQQILDKDGRGIVLDQSTYVNHTVKARFIDPKYGEWWTRPMYVLSGCNHPNRVGKQRVTAEEIQKRLKEQGRDVILDASTYKNTQTKARFIDPQFGEWWAKPNNVLNGTDHPNYAKNRPLTISDVQSRLQQINPYITLDVSTYVNTHVKARFVDADFGEWWTKPYIVLNGHQHPNRIFKQNKLETFIVEQLGVKWIGDGKTTGLRYKPDFQLSDTVYLNVDGLYWHSDVHREKVYHFVLRKWFEENGLRILQFREHEIRDKWHIVKGIINAVLNKVENKIGARECELVRLSAKECFEFYEQWHLKGGIKVSGYGLKYKDELVAAISVKKVKDVLKIERFCVKSGWSVSGGYSRLLGRVLQDYQGIVKVQSWVDLRYGDGHSLEKMGFVKVKDTLGWEWTDFKTTYNRLQCRANMDERGLSEREHAEELGWVRIYDAGQRLFEKIM